MEILLIHHGGLRPVLVPLMLMNLVSLLGLINLAEETQVKAYFKPVIHELTFR
jgi:hypothetical protein